MRFEYSGLPADAAYIHLSDNPDARPVQSHECDVDGLLELDFDAGGHLVGLELIPASMYLHWLPAPDGRLGVHLQLEVDGDADRAVLYLLPKADALAMATAVLACDPYPVSVAFAPEGQVVSLTIDGASKLLDATTLGVAEPHP